MGPIHGRCFSVDDAEKPRLFVVGNRHLHPVVQEVPKGTKLITEGDLDADYFYIVQSGPGLWALGVVVKK